MDLPTIAKIDNNLVKVKIGPVSVWFSYETPIAFQVNKTLICHENIWSRSTGKHLNLIDGGQPKNRCNSMEFNKLWRDMAGGLMVSGLFQH